MIFNYDANITHFHNKGFALSLVLKVRFFGTRKWPTPAAIGLEVTTVDGFETKHVSVFNLVPRAFTFLGSRPCLTFGSFRHQSIQPNVGRRMSHNGFIIRLETQRIPYLKNQSRMRDTLTINFYNRIFGSIKVLGKLPTYPSLKLTLTLTSYLGQNGSLGEG